MAYDSVRSSGVMQSLGDFLADLSDLVQKEIRLAKAEVVERSTPSLQACIPMGVAAFLGLVAALLVVEAAVFAIASFGLALYWACLLVAAILAAAAAGGVLSRAFRRRGDPHADADGQASHQGYPDSQGAADMSRYSEIETYSQAGDWLVGHLSAAIPKPCLLMAAGCVLVDAKRQLRVLQELT